MSFRIVARSPGGIDQLELQEWDPPAPAAGEVLIRHAAIGVNFIDIYFRTGLYPRPAPIALGSEAAGVVVRVGPGVADVRVGDRVAYADGGSGGAYASHAMVSASRLVLLPDTVAFDDAAAILLKGMTVEMLVERCARVQAGQSVLVHAAAGGVGSLLVPWLASIGALVIAHAGTAAKAERARELGAHHALHCPLIDLAGEVRRLTDGRGVDHVLDGVGAASWAASLASVAKRGLIVSYGNASGAVPPVAPLELLRAGSVFLTRPTMGDYLETPDALRASAARLFDQIAGGAIRVQIGARLPLAEAAEAHRMLEARETTGSIVLIP